MHKAAGFCRVHADDEVDLRPQSHIMDSQDLVLYFPAETKQDYGERRALIFSLE